HALGKLRWNRVAIDRNQSIRRLSPAHFLRNPLPKLVHRLRDKVLELLPVRLLGVPLVLIPLSPRPVTKAGSLRAQLGVVQQLLPVPHAIPPTTEVPAADRSAPPGPVRPSTATRQPIPPSARAIPTAISRPAVAFLPPLAVVWIPTPKAARPLRAL